MGKFYEVDEVDNIAERKKRTRQEAVPVWCACILFVFPAAKMIHAV